MSFFKGRTSLLSKKVTTKKPKIGLCLGGGGARGYAHIGAIKAFEEIGVDFDLCVGTSVGSILGAFYCSNVSYKDLYQYASNIDMRAVHNGIILTPNDASKIGRVVTDFIGNASIEDLKKPYAAVSVDLVEGKQVIIDSGNVGFACSASSAVPIFFRPMIRGNQHLVDGGLLNNIPAEVCRLLGADKVVTIDINPTRGGGTEELGFLDILKATFSIMSSNSSLQGLINSDIVIAPDLSKFKATTKDGYDEMIELGYIATMNQSNEIKALFNAL